MRIELYVGGELVYEREVQHNIDHVAFKVYDDDGDQLNHVSWEGEY